MTSNVQPSVDCEMVTKYELMHGKPCLNPIYCNICSEEEGDGCFTFNYILAFVYVSVLVCVPVSLFRSATMG